MEGLGYLAKGSRAALGTLGGVKLPGGDCEGLGGLEEPCVLRAGASPRWPPTWASRPVSPQTPYPPTVLKKQPTRQLRVARIATPNVFVP